MRPSRPAEGFPHRRSSAGARGASLTGGENDDGFYSRIRNINACSRLGHINAPAAPSQTRWQDWRSHMHLHLGILAIMVAAGLACGFLNTVASSGSAVSLPVLILAGLHAVDADATNRIPVLIGGLAASAQLARSGVMRWKYVALAGVPVTAGPACGAVLAELIPSHDVRMLITGAIVMALILILTKLKELVRSAPLGEPRFGWRQIGWFLLVGLWVASLCSTVPPTWCWCWCCRCGCRSFRPMP